MGCQSDALSVYAHCTLYRLVDLENRKRRGKGTPKKGKSIVLNYQSSSNPNVWQAKARRLSTGKRSSKGSRSVCCICTNVVFLLANISPKGCCLLCNASSLFVLSYPYMQGICTRHSFLLRRLRTSRCYQTLSLLTMSEQSKGRVSTAS